MTQHASTTINPTGSPKIYPAAPSGSRTEGEFDRFADLAGKLVAVPKAEIDEKRGKS